MHKISSFRFSPSCDKLRLARYFKIETRQIIQQLSDNKLFSAGYNCAQSVLAEYSTRLGLQTDLALKLATPFGGGMGRQGHICGAVSGALMVIGLRFGNADHADKISRDKAYAVTQEFNSRFAAACGSLYCRDLLGLDLSQPGALELVRSDERFRRICSSYVQSAIDLVAELI
jgi:C_GCAxxG_C_C family probable redox protein